MVQIIGRIIKGQRVLKCWLFSIVSMKLLNSENLSKIKFLSQHSAKKKKKKKKLFLKKKNACRAQNLP